MTIPLTVRISALVLVSTAFYTYVGQMVPQKEVLPPQETVLATDLTPADMVKVGREIMEGKGLCFTCHTVGKSGALRFPDLDGVAARAGDRIPGMNDVDYLAQSMYEPDSYIVEGFNPGMPAINKPPIGLTDQEILCVIAYLQTLGGTPTVTLQTTHRYLAAPATPGGAPPPAQPGEPQPLPAPSQGAAPAGAEPAAAGTGARLAPEAASPSVGRSATGRETELSGMVVAAGLVASHEAARPAGEVRR
jgi:hypothetical protein